MDIKRDIERVIRIKAIVADPRNEIEQNALIEYLAEIPLDQRSFPRSTVELDTIRQVESLDVREDLKLARSLTPSIDEDHLLDHISMVRSLDRQTDVDTQYRRSARLDHDQFVLETIDKAIVHYSPRPFVGRERLAVKSACNGQTHYKAIYTDQGIYSHTETRSHTRSGYDVDTLPIGYGKILEIQDSVCTKNVNNAIKTIDRIDTQETAKRSASERLDTLTAMNRSSRQRQRSEGTIAQRGSRGKRSSINK